MLKIQAHGRQEIIDIKNKKPWSMHVNIYIKKQYFTNLFYVVTYKFHDLWVNSLKRSQGQLSKKVLSLYIHTNKSLDRLYQSNVSIWKFCHRSLFIIWKTNLGYETNSLYEPRTTERQTDRQKYSSWLFQHLHFEDNVKQHTDDVSSGQSTCFGVCRLRGEVRRKG